MNAMVLNTPEEYRNSVIELISVVLCIHDIYIYIYIVDKVF